MKLTVKEVLDSQAGLSTLMQKDIPIKASFKLSRLIKKLNGELETFNEKRKELFTKFGEDIGDGKLKIKQEDAEEYNKNLEELVSIEIEIDCETLNLNELGDEIKISAADAMDLEKFISID